MLFIDTNTLYYAFGLSSHSSVSGKKICQIIDSHEKVVISSISFAEFLCKYHKHANTIRRVCSFMRQHHIDICESQYIPFKCDIIKKLRTINQPELDQLFKKLVIIKSHAESKFATTVFFVVLLSETIFECNIDPYRVPECVKEFFALIYKDSLNPIISDMFKMSYNKAYKTDNAENLIRKYFYDYLKLFVSLCVPLCKHFIDEFDKIPDGEIVDVSAIVKKYSDTNWADEMTQYQNRIEKQNTPAQFIKRKGLSYGKGINDKHLSALLSGLDSSFRKTIGVTSIEEYLYSIVSNTLLNGGAFRKNDINDALILSDLKSCDMILTFDDRMIEHMKKHSENRKEYLNSTSLISSILS